MAAGDPVYATGGILATDLGEDWEWQSGDVGQAAEHAKAPSSTGDTTAECIHGEHVTGSEKYLYIGTATDYTSATTGAIVAAAAMPGRFLTTANAVILSVEIDYSPCAQGKREVVTFTFSRGIAADDHEYLASLTTVLKTKQENDGIPNDLLANANATSKCTAATYAIKCEEGRDLDKVGDYLCGAVYGGEESLNMTHCGVPSLTAGTWMVTTSQVGTGEGSLSNVTYGTFNTVAVKMITRTAVV